jgi:CubicO group peptidase (beta-lactamase class C family)
LGKHVAARTGRPFEDVLREFVLSPLGMDETELLERPSQGLHGPIGDMGALAVELLRPTLLAPETARAATTVAFPGLVGVVPGVGRFDPCDWGLGPELHDGKTPHWMGASNSAATFGHIGGAGTFVWVDPVADVALVTLTDRDFGPWALDAWPSFSDSVVAATADAVDKG